MMEKKIIIMDGRRWLLTELDDKEEFPKFNRNAKVKITLPPIILDMEEIDPEGDIERRDEILPFLKTSISIYPNMHRWIKEWNLLQDVYYKHLDIEVLDD